MAYQVPVSSIPLLQDPPFVLWLAGLGAAAGYRTLRWLGAPLAHITAVERGVLSSAIGLALLQYVVFALGMARCLTPAAVWIALVVSTIALMPDLLRVGRGIVRTALRAKARKPTGWIMLSALVLLVPFVFAACQSLCPPTDFDGMTYHLAAPKRWLQMGRIDYLPTLVHTNAPMGVEMLYTLALAVWSDTAAHLIAFVLGCLAFASVFALGRRYRNEAVGFVAMAAFAIAVPKFYWLREATLANVDLGITLEFTAAVLAWLLWSRTRHRGWLWTAALLAGFTGSFKLTGICTGPAMAAIVWWECRRQGEPRASAARSAVIFAAISLLPVAPWLWRAWVQTGNPIWPLFPSVFPSRDWSAEAAAGFDRHFKYYNWGGNASLSFEKRKMLRMAALALAALATGLCAWRWREREGSALGVLMGLLALVGIYAAGLYYRFFIFLQPLLYVLALGAIARPLTRFRSVHAVVVAACVFGAVSYVPWAQPLGTYPRFWVTFPEAVSTASGATGREAYLERNFAPIRLWRYANANVPPDRPVLLAGLNMGYYSDRYTYNVDGYGRARIRLDRYDHFLDDLHRERIDYVVVNRSLISGEIPKIGPAANEGPFVRRLVAENGRLLFTSQDDGLYQIVARPAGRP